MVKTPQLQKCTETTIKNLRRGGIYPSELSFSYEPKRGTLSFHRGTAAGLPYKDGCLDDLFIREEIKSSQFYDLGRGTRKVTSIAPIRSMLYKRIIMEIAKKTPFPKFKNHLYQHLGVDIPEPSEVIVAPNVFIDYINPELLRIEPGVFVGEEAMISTHYFDHEKFVIGNIVIGEDTLVGGRSLIGPGTNIGRSVLIGANAAVSGIVPDGTKIKPCQYFLR